MPFLLSFHHLSRVLFRQLFAGVSRLSVRGLLFDFQVPSTERKTQGRWRDLQYRFEGMPPCVNSRRCLSPTAATSAVCGVWSAQALASQSSPAALEKDILLLVARRRSVFHGRRRCNSAGNNSRRHDSITSAVLTTGLRTCVPGPTPAIRCPDQLKPSHASNLTRSHREGLPGVYAHRSPSGLFLVDQAP